MTFIWILPPPLYLCQSLDFKEFSWYIWQCKTNQRIMKKILTPIVVLAIFFLFFLWLFSTRETTMDINLFGAGYVTSLLAIYLIIISIGNPDYHKMWWNISEDMTPEQNRGFTIGNFLICMSVCWASLNLPRESLSDISVVLYSSLPVFVVVVAFFVRRLIVKGK